MAPPELFVQRTRSLWGVCMSGWHEGGAGACGKSRLGRVWRENVTSLDIRVLAGPSWEEHHAQLDALIAQLHAWPSFVVVVVVVVVVVS